MTRLRAAAAVVLATLIGGACDGDGGDAPDVSRDVQDLRVPSDDEREAAAKLHEAGVFIEAEEMRAAEPLLRRVLEIRPGDRRAAELLARCMMDRGDLEAAIPLLRHALEGAARNGGLNGLLITVLMNLGRYGEAERAARAWTEADAQSVDAWYELGRALYRLNRFEDSIQAFRRAEGLKSTRADVRSEMGLALAAAGRLPLAEAKLRDATERQPDYADAWFRLGDVIFRRDPARVKEAVDAMSKAVTLEPTMIVGHLFLFRVCRLARVPEGDPIRERGEQAWRAVLRLHDRAQLAPLLAGVDGNVESTSERVLREQAALSPDDPAPRAALARFLHASRRYDDATDAYRRAIELGATDPKLRLLVAAALVAQALPPSVRAAAPGTAESARAATLLREAETHCCAAVAAVPGDPVASRALAWVLLLQGRDADARDAAEAAIAAWPDDLLAKKVRALARMHAGEVDPGLEEIAALGWL